MVILGAENALLKEKYCKVMSWRPSLVYNECIYDLTAEGAEKAFSSNMNDMDLNIDKWNEWSAVTASGRSYNRSRQATVILEWYLFRCWLWSEVATISTMGIGCLYGTRG